MRREDLQLVTPEQFKRFGPCWLITSEGRTRYMRISAMKDEWSATDVLELEDVSAHDKLWAVLREEFLPSMILHEFACRCAEWALSFFNAPDTRIVDAILVKRRWMVGEATDKELDFAQAAADEAALEPARSAQSAAAWATAGAAEWDAEWSADSAAAWAAEVAAEWAAERAAAGSAAWATEEAAENAAIRDAKWALAGDAEREAAREQEVDMLRELIDEWK